MHLTHVANTTYREVESGKLLMVLARDPLTKAYTFLTENGGTIKCAADEITVEEKINAHSNNH